jgi:hypothetical protein
VQQVQVQVSVMETFPCSVRKQGDDLFSHWMAHLNAVVTSAKAVPFHIFCDFN